MVDEVLLALRSHAEGSEEGLEPLLLADALRRARAGQPPGDLGQIWADLVSALEAYRGLIDPAEVSQDCFSEEWDNPVLWVSKMVTDCLDFFANQEGDWDARHEFLMLGWRLDCAWDALQSGVQGSLAEHVENEAQSRQFLD